MSSELEKIFVNVISDALQEINEILGYGYFEPTEIEEKSKQFVILLPLVQELMLKPIRGITLKDLEKEEPDY